MHQFRFAILIAFVFFSSPAWSDCVTRTITTSHFKVLADGPTFSRPTWIGPDSAVTASGTATVCSGVNKARRARLAAADAAVEALFQRLDETGQNGFRNTLFAAFRQRCQRGFHANRIRVFAETGLSSPSVIFIERPMERPFMCSNGQPC